jgi:uncharacterized protein
MTPTSDVSYFVFRLKPGDDLKKAILSFAFDNNIEAGVIVTCVGSLEQYHLRFARKQDGEKLKGHFEIVSLTGTLSGKACHLHIALADNAGKTIGGHLLDENIIYTTAEIAILSFNDLSFERKLDDHYGYQELIVSPKVR